jgi:L-alanine-DL-glutamate epimerase-like enolase superfamily enzyme
MSDRIREVRVDTITLPLPRPLRLGPMEVREREYAAVTVTTEEGLAGRSYCLTRNAPVAALVQRLVEPHVVGRDAEPVERIWDDVQRANVTVARSGLALRALALVDVALWDVKAQRAGVPLRELLGGARDGDRSAPAMLVAAYPTSDRDPAEVAAEALAGAACGVELVKVSRDPDPVRMRALIEGVQPRLPAGTGLVVDAGFGWRSAEAALAESAQWGEAPLAWLEDPLVPEDAEGCARIRRESRHPIATGDEVTERRTYDALLAAGAIDVLRLDVIAIGGITPALDVLARADAAAVPVSFHVYPEISVHLATARARAPWVELFDPAVPGGNPYDPAHRLIAAGAALEGGRLVAPDAPGLGLAFDPEVVR